MLRVRAGVRGSDPPRGELNREALPRRRTAVRSGRQHRSRIQWGDPDELPGFVVGACPHGECIAGSTGADGHLSAIPVGDPCERPVGHVASDDGTDGVRPVAVFDACRDPGRIVGAHEDPGLVELLASTGDRTAGTKRRNAMSVGRLGLEPRTDGL